MFKYVHSTLRIMAKYEIKNGYKVFKNSGKSLHRYQGELKYGKEAIKDKVIHHIDGDKLNNTKTNLLAVSKEDHYSITLHENKIRLLSQAIIWLSGLYLIIVIPLSYGVIPSKFVNVARLSVIGILACALELRYNVISKAIRRPRSKIDE